MSDLRFFFCLQKHRVVIPNEEAILRKERQSIALFLYADDDIIFRFRKVWRHFRPRLSPLPLRRDPFFQIYKLFKQKVLFPSVLKRYFGIKSRRNEKKMVCLYIKKYMYELSVFSQSQSNIWFNECLRSKSFSILATESMSLKRFCFVLRIKETKTVGV